MVISWSTKHSSGIPQNICILEGSVLGLHSNWELPCSLCLAFSAWSMASSPSSRAKGRVLAALESHVLSEARVEEFREARPMQRLCPIENLSCGLKGELRPLSVDHW